MSDQTISHDQTLEAEQSSSLWSASFIGLLFTQFLTAINDNVFRWLIIGIGKDYVSQDNVGMILTMGTVCFVLPYLLLAAFAGYLADRFSKSRVIFVCKVAEILIMLLGVIAILSQQIWFLFLVVALTGAQSALFAPSKLGCIPEILKPNKIPGANGLFGLSTVAAIVIGMGVGGALKDATGKFGLENLWISAATLLGVAIAGTLFSLMIKRLRVANPKRSIPWDSPMQTLRDLRELGSSRPLLRVALGIVFFWSVGALAQLNIDQFAPESFQSKVDVTASSSSDVSPIPDKPDYLESFRTPFLISLVLGLGFGSVLAGVCSQGRIELGLLPLGAGGIALGSFLLFGAEETLIEGHIEFTFGFVWACLMLFGLGTSAGMFDVPLESYMQHHSPREKRGAILSATNFLTFSGIFLSAVLYYVLQEKLGLSAREIFLFVSVCTIPVLLYVLFLIPQATIRFLVWLLSLLFYRVKVYDRDKLPERGGALLVANHVTWLDGALLLLTSSRPVRLVAWAGNFKSKWLQRFAEFWGVILISGGPKSIVKALSTAREALQNGELVGIFPEGGFTRSGQVQTFRPGMMKILKGTDAPVIPIYLDELWGSIFSLERGKSIWQWPKRLPYSISIHFGDLIESPDDIHTIRQAVLELGARAMEKRSDKITNLPSAFIRRCKERKHGSKVADSTGVDLGGGSLLTRCLVLRRLLRRHVLQDGEEYVGLLLPPSLGGLAANMALSLDRRIAVNLNYTVTSEVLNACNELCGIQHVLTSRKFMEKMNFDIDAELVYLEDFRDDPAKGATLGDKLASYWEANFKSATSLERKLGLDEIETDDIVTIIFTSGSTGTPKGVMLSHGNITHNIEAIEQVMHLSPDDVLVGILPFFHSLGYSVTLWGSMALDIKGCYHFSPLDGKQIGKLVEKNKGTLLLSTPTFLRTFLKRCTKEQFASLDVVVAGAEKLPGELCDAFEEKFGIRPVEGYGCTETAPLVSVNVPKTRSGDNFQVDCKEGTVGRPAPSVIAKVTNLDTGEELGANEPGMLWVKGPNIMKGYLKREDLTSEVIDDGWYKTGDVALIDDDGFIKITGRISRFSKIGGEMVPHIKIEDTLTKLIGADEEEGLKAAVTAVPDTKKGERLIVIHTELGQSIDDLRKGLTNEGLPNIFIPSADSFYQVDEIPILGTGKFDLKGIKQMAMDRFGSE